MSTLEKDLIEQAEQMKNMAIENAKQQLAEEMAPGIKKLFEEKLEKESKKLLSKTIKEQEENKDDMDKTEEKDEEGTAEVDLDDLAKELETEKPAEGSEVEDRVAALEDDVNKVKDVVIDIAPEKAEELGKEASDEEEIEFDEDELSASDEKDETDDVEVDVEVEDEADEDDEEEEVQEESRIRRQRIRERIERRRAMRKESVDISVDGDNVNLNVSGGDTSIDVSDAGGSSDFDGAFGDEDEIEVVDDMGGVEEEETPVEETEEEGEEETMKTESLIKHRQALRERIERRRRVRALRERIERRRSLRKEQLEPEKFEQVLDVEGEDENWVKETTPDKEDWEKTHPKMESRSLRRRLIESRRAMRKAQMDLNETNTLNKKLVLVSRIFAKHNLSKVNKYKILEAFDKCETIRESVVVYRKVMAKFAESTKKPVEVVKELKESKETKTVSEVLTESVTAKTPTGVLPDDRVLDIDRVQKLAGIKPITRK